MTPTKTWKAWERRVAQIFGGVRRGAHTSTGGEGSGLSDVIHPHWSIEAKLVKRAGFAFLLEAALQAEDAVESDAQEPVAVVKINGAPIGEALVIQRLVTFQDWRLGGSLVEGE